MGPRTRNTYFLAAGDLHTGSIPTERLASLFRAAARHGDARFLAVPGDLTNDGTPEQYALLRPYTQRLPFRFYGTMGNHDVMAGPDEEARRRFCHALGVEGPSYSRTFDGFPFLFLSTDGDVDGARVEIRRSMGLLQSSLASGASPLFVFCHAPLTGTVDGAPGRACFSSDDPAFGLPESEAVRAMVHRAGRPVFWISGHTHSPLEAEGLIHTERLGDSVLHSVNVSSPFFTGRDVKRDDPILLYRFGVEPDATLVRIEDVARGECVREEQLAHG